MQKYTIKTTADDRADTIVYFPICGNLGLINSPNFLRGYPCSIIRNNMRTAGMSRARHFELLAQC